MLEDKNTQKTSLAELGEFGLINHITKYFKVENASTIKAIGDDAAVLDASKKQTLVTTDLLIEGVHFDLSYMPLKHLGYKAVMVNLSDVYAMNGTAEQITVSIAVSNRFPLEAIEELYAGIQLACNTYKVDLVGGDTTSSTKGILISVTAIGKAEKDEVVYRNGAKVGDTICAVYDGVVVGSIDKYEYGGSHKRWRKYANYITLYHPELGIYTQYVHLVKNGGLVNLGDTVVMNQPIALSGLTGWTDVEHLHFNVLVPDEEGMHSYPVDFIEGYKGKELKRGNVIRK